MLDMRSIARRSAQQSGGGCCWVLLLQEVPGQGTSFNVCPLHRKLSNMLQLGHSYVLRLNSLLLILIPNCTHLGTCCERTAMRRQWTGEFVRASDAYSACSDAVGRGDGIANVSSSSRQAGKLSARSCRPGARAHTLDSWLPMHIF